MKKILSVLLAAVMLFSFSACSIKRIQRDEDGKVIQEQAPQKKSYSDMTFEEKLEYMSTREREFVATEDSQLLAPACELGSSSYGYINNHGDWVIDPKFTYAYSFNEGYAPVIDEYNVFEFIDSTGSFVQTNTSRKISMKAAKHFYELYVAAVYDTGYEQTKMYHCVDGITQISAEKLPTTKGVSYGSKTYFAVATQFCKGYAVTMRRTNDSIIESTGLDKAKSKGYLQSASVIDAIGNVVAQLPEGLDVYDYSMNANGTVTVRDMTDEQQRFGVCNIEGELVIPCEYYLIEYCEDGLYMASDANGFFGYINEEGKKIIDFKYTAAYPFSEGVAAVCEGDKWGVINTSGEYIFAPSFDYIAGLKYSDIDVNVNVAACCDGVLSIKYGDYWALLDTKSKILDAVYAPGLEKSPYTNVGNGFVIFTDYQDGIAKGIGVLDLAGNLVLEAKYESIGMFNE